ncbi:MAG: hypothetical protein EOM67_13140 [Spirochaetia bacterium]|nr:hypothetical protein [Spirochaetia bacterium]
MSKVGKLIASYADYEVTDAEVKHRMENREDFDYDEDMTEEQIREKVYNDSYIYEEAYDDCCYAIGEVFARKFKTLCAKVEGVNLNWRGSSGYKYVCLEKFNSVDDYSNIGRQLISSLFSGGDFTLECSNYGKGLFFRISHHDCPTGSCYYLTPCARSTYETNS